jgi:nucleoid-associated protein YgaU
MKQNQFSNLPKVSIYRYENFFNVYQDQTGNYYNLLKAINVFQSNNDNVQEDYNIKYTDTWYSISYRYYNTMELWWLICTYNQIMDASKMPEPGTIIKLLKPNYVGIVLEQLYKQTIN